VSICWFGLLLIIVTVGLIDECLFSLLFWFLGFFGLIGLYRTGLGLLTLLDTAHSRRDGGKVA
jgi:uncharacterized membrane protein